MTTQRTFDDYLKDVVGEEEAQGLGNITAFSDPDDSYEQRIDRADQVNKNDNNGMTNNLSMISVTPPHPIRVNREGVDHHHPDISHAWSDLESKSFVNGLLSPFSPLLTKRVNKERREELANYISLQPCLKVSVVVRVLDQNDGSNIIQKENDVDGIDEDDDQLCVFPHTKEPMQTTTNGSIIGKSTPTRTPEHSSLLGVQGGKSSKKPSPRDLIIVKPSAFGKYVPNQVTMETARLVAQVAQISSEDWARLYEFHHVIWPSSSLNDADHPKTPSKVTASSDKSSSVGANNDDSNSFSSFDSIARAVAQDATVELKSSVIISLGHTSSCIGQPDALTCQILSHMIPLLEAKAVCRITILELDEEGNLHDLLASSSSDMSSPSLSSSLDADVSYQSDSALQIRHVDNKGAIVQGLVEVTIDSMPTVLQLLDGTRNRRKRSKHQRGRFRKGGSVTTIATISVWRDAVQHELSKLPACQVTCVELVPSQQASPSNGKNSSTISNGIKHRLQTPSPTKTTVSAMSASTALQRKSVVTLGLALRQLLLQSIEQNIQSSIDFGNTMASPMHKDKNGMRTPNRSLQQHQGSNGGSFIAGSPTTITTTTTVATSSKMVSFRESTLTKLLQRCLEDESSKVVVVASISPLSSQYESTLATLNYVRRLLVAPGRTAASPFRTNRADITHATDQSSLMYNYNAGASTPLVTFNDASNGRRVEPPSAPRSGSTDEEGGDGTTDPPPSPLLQEYGKNEALLKHLVADPRQRLAKIFNMNKPPLPKEPVGVEIPHLPSGLEDDADYPVVDYMEELNLNPITSPDKMSRPRNSGAEEKVPTTPAADHQERQLEQDHSYLSTEPEFRTPAQSSSLQRYPMPSSDGGDSSLPNDYENQQGSILAGQQWSSPLAKGSPSREDYSDLNHDVGGLQRADPAFQDYGVEGGGHNSTNFDYSVDHSYSHQAGNQDEEQWLGDLPSERNEGVEPPGMHAAHESSLQHELEEAPVEKVDDDRGENQVEYSLQDDHEDFARNPDHVEGHGIGNDHDSGLDLQNSETMDEETEDHVRVEQDSPLKKYLDGEGEDDAQNSGDVGNLRSYSLGLEDDDLSELDELEDNEAPNHGQAKSLHSVSHLEDAGQRGAEHVDKSNDDRNTSRWSDWNSDNENEDDLDLEPQTNYDLPEAPTQRCFQYTDPSDDKAEGSAYSTPSNRGFWSLSSSREKDDRTSPLRAVGDSPKAASPKDAGGSSSERHLNVRESPSLASTVKRSNKFASSTDPNIQDGGNEYAISSETNSKLKSASRREISSSRSLQEGLDERDMSNSNEVEVLEDAVNQIKMIHSDLWESSALSLQRLKRTQKAQQEAVEKALALRDDALWELDRIKDENRSIADSHADELHRYKNDLEALQDRLDKALADKGAVERIADEAISAQDSLERRVRNLEESLTDCKRQNESTKSLLEDELQQTKRKLDRLEDENKDENMRSSKMELSLRQLSEENLHLTGKREADRSRIEGLVGELRQLELSRKRLEAEKTQAEEKWKDEQSQIESLKIQSRSFGMSLENLEKERERLRDTKREHQLTIEKMEDELRRLRLLVKTLETERDHLKSLHDEDKVKLDGLQKQLNDLRAAREELERERSNLVQLRQNDQDAIENLEADSRQARIKLENLEAEFESLVQLKDKNHRTIERLRATLKDGEKNESEIKHLQDQMMLLKKENVDYSAIIERRRSEHSEEVSRMADEIKRYKLEMDSLKDEISTKRERDLEATNNAESEIRRLRERLSKYQSEVVETQRERSEALHKLESMEARHSKQAQTLAEKDLQIGSFQSEVSQLRDELADLQGREKVKASSAARDIRRLEDQLLELQTEFSKARRDAEDATTKLEKASVASETLSGDYERTRTKLVRQEANLDRLARELDAANEDKRRAEEKLANTRTQLGRYQSDAKKKIDSVMNHQQEVRREQSTLAKENEQLRRKLQQAQRERDLLYRSLENGRDQMATIAVKNRGPTMRGDTTLRPVSEVNAPRDLIGPDRISHAPTDFYLTEYPAGDSWMSTRTEELVTYLAASAKKTIEESQDEASQLRAKVYSLESELGRGRSRRAVSQSRSRRGIDPTRDGSDDDDDNRAYIARHNSYR